MKKNNKTCICCGEVYTYCPNCGEFAHLEKWHTLYHNANCKKLFDIATDFIYKEIDEATARNKFAECDLSYKNKLHHSIKEVIDKLNVKQNDVKEKKDVTK